jgi:hypothetical protein
MTSIASTLRSPQLPNARVFGLLRMRWVLPSCSGRGCGRTLRAEELSRDVEGLAAHDDDLLAVEQLLRDRAGQTAEQMALSVNAT